MPDRLKLMQMGLLGEKQKELETLRVRIRRLIDDLRVYSFYQNANEPELVDAEAAHQAACDLVAAKGRALDLKQEIEGLRQALGLEEETAI